MERAFSEQANGPRHGRFLAQVRLKRPTDFDAAGHPAPAGRGRLGGIPITSAWAHNSRHIRTEPASARCGSRQTSAARGLILPQERGNPCTSRSNRGTDGPQAPAPAESPSQAPGGRGPWSAVGRLLGAGRLRPPPTSAVMGRWTCRTGVWAICAIACRRVAGACPEPCGDRLILRQPAEPHPAAAWLGRAVPS